MSTIRWIVVVALVGQLTYGLVRHSLIPSERQEVIRIMSIAMPCSPERADMTIRIVAKHKGISEDACVKEFLQIYAAHGMR